MSYAYSNHVQIWSPRRWRLVRLESGALGIAFGERENSWLVRYQLSPEAATWDILDRRECLEPIGRLYSGTIETIVCQGADLVDCDSGERFKLVSPKPALIIAPGQDLLAKIVHGNGEPSPFLSVGVAVRFDKYFEIPEASEPIGWQVLLSDLTVQHVYQSRINNVIPLFGNRRAHR